MRSGALSFSADFSGTGSKGPVELDGRAVTNDQLVNSACGATPCKLGEIHSGRNELRFELSYAIVPATDVHGGADLRGKQPDAGRRLPRFLRRTAAAARRAERLGTAQQLELGRHASPCFLRAGARLQRACAAGGGAFGADRGGGPQAQCQGRLRELRPANRERQLGRDRRRRHRRLVGPDPGWRRAGGGQAPRAPTRSATGWATSCAAISGRAATSCHG